MAADRGVPGAGLYGDLPPSYTRSQPPANPDLLRRPSYCHAAFALKQISKVTQCSQVFFALVVARSFSFSPHVVVTAAACLLSRIRFVSCWLAAISALRTRVGEALCPRRSGEVLGSPMGDYHQEPSCLNGRVSVELCGRQNDRDDHLITAATCSPH